MSDDGGDGAGDDRESGGSAVDPPAGRVAKARAYYRALDEHDYDLLGSLLTADFVHERPDMTLSGRDRFVRFMRSERPQLDTSHPIDGVYEEAGGAAEAGAVVVQGRLLDADGERITAFADSFSFEGENIERVVTYTR